MYKQEKKIRGGKGREALTGFRKRYKNMEEMEGLPDQDQPYTMCSFSVQVPLTTLSMIYLCFYNQYKQC